VWYYKAILKGKEKGKPLSDGYQAYKHDAKKADKNIKYCESCNKCWEIDGSKANGSYYRDKGIKPTLFYEDFPILGRERKQCEECE
jgi:multimeric flavodoxin WrbA